VSYSYGCSRESGDENGSFQVELSGFSGRTGLVEAGWEAISSVGAIAVGRNTTILSFEGVDCVVSGAGGGGDSGSIGGVTTEAMFPGAKSLRY